MSTAEIPLFPLRSVLCPGVALPLHIFEERYRLMISRCIERGEAFGVVLVRAGRPGQPGVARLAEIGTTAAIRRAGRYPDGRIDILTVGQERFRLESVDDTAEPYLLGHVDLIGEPIGPSAEASRQAHRVGQRFLSYLELLQPGDEPDGPEIEIEFEIELDEDEVASLEPRPLREEPASGPEGVVPFDPVPPLVEEMDAAGLTAEQRRELLMSAARRLTATDDPTALSYVLTALIQVDLSSRQKLLEAPDTLQRLIGLDGLLAHETYFLQQGLRPMIVDPRQMTRRST